MTIILRMALVTSFLSFPAFAAPPELSDTEAARIIEVTWNGVPNGGVQVGQISLVRDGFSGSGPTATQQEFQWIKAWAQVGIVTIREDPSYQQFNSGETFSWNQLLQNTTAGVLTVVDVEPTKRGLSIGKVSTGFLRFRPQTVTVDHVVRNEYIRRGVDDFQVVWFTYTQKPEDYFLEYIAALGHTYIDHGKGRALFKYDPFKATWQYFVADQAEGDSEITTDFVNKYLQ